MMKKNYFYAHLSVQRSKKLFRRSLFRNLNNRKEVLRFLNLVNLELVCGVEVSLQRCCLVFRRLPARKLS